MEGVTRSLPDRKETKTLIILDSNYMAWRALYSVKNLSFNEFSTGIIYGFLRDVCFLAEYFSDSQFVFAFDGKGSYRKEFYPEYKSNRKQKRESMTDDELLKFSSFNEQFQSLRDEVLKKIGFKNILWQDKIEADDVIARVAINQKTKFGVRPIVVGSDLDLLQLLDYCDIFHPKERKLITAKSFRKTYGIEPSQWTMVKAIAGCTSDHVAGVKGVAEKSAINYLLNKLPNGAKYNSILRSRDVIERNIKLVKLPHEKTKNFPIIPCGSLSQRGFDRICDDYNFLSFQKSDYLKRWRAYFKFK